MTRKLQKRLNGIGIGGLVLGMMLTLKGDSDCRIRNIQIETLRETNNSAQTIKEYENKFRASKYVLGIGAGIFTGGGMLICVAHYLKRKQEQ